MKSQNLGLSAGSPDAAAAHVGENQYILSSVWVNIIIENSTFESAANKIKSFPVIAIDVSITKCII